jgi:hypothetical protein
MAPVLRLTAVAAVALVLIPAGGSGSSTGSGLYGSVRKGPVMPVCQQGVPCDAPAQLTLVFSRTTASGETTGTTPVSVRSDKNGHYRIALAPGYYDVAATKKVGTTKLPKPHAVHVRKGHWDKITFSFDTGIR